MIADYQSRMHTLKALNIDRGNISFECLVWMMYPSLFATCRAVTHATWRASVGMRRAMWSYQPILQSIPSLPTIVMQKLYDWVPVIQYWIMFLRWFVPGAQTWSRRKGEWWSICFIGWSEVNRSRWIQISQIFSAIHASENLSVQTARAHGRRENRWMETYSQQPMALVAKLIQIFFDLASCLFNVRYLPERDVVADILLLCIVFINFTYIFVRDVAGL